MNNATTLPEKVSFLDWGTRDPATAMVMGKSLVKRGNVIWRHTLREWKVIDPTLDGVYWTVQLGPTAETDVWPWKRLTCTCLPKEHPDDPCVHKAAVYVHVTLSSEYSYYHEGY